METKKQLNTPVLLITFNRPDITEKVFQAIREARPKKLFISVDGPREGNKRDEENVKKVREIVSKVNWPCSVKKIFHENNLGCRKAESSALKWFFDNVEEGIVFEDDCLPGPDFFNFCEEMLEKYRNDERVMHISGNNFLKNWRRDKYSYYFSKYPFSWGWASWKRAFKKYDVGMLLYPEVKKKGYLKDLYPNYFERKKITQLLDKTYKGLDTWDYQWLFAIMVNGGLCVVPNTNLVRNIGFGEDSTHTTKLDSYLSIPTKEIEFPLKHPPFVIRDAEADKRYFRNNFWKRLINYLMRKLSLRK